MMRKRSTPSSMCRLCVRFSRMLVGPGELDQVVLTLALMADLVGQRPRVPVVVALDAATTVGDLRVDLREDRARRSSSAVAERTSIRS